MIRRRRTVRWVVSPLVLARQDVRERRLVHLMHQRADLFRAHWYAGEYADLQRGAQKNGAQPLLDGHESLSARATAQRYLRLTRNQTRERLGGPRESMLRRYGVAGASQRSNSTSAPVGVSQSRRTNAVGTTTQSRETPPSGSNAATAMSAMQATATVLRRRVT